MMNRNLKQSFAYAAAASAVAGVLPAFAATHAIVPDALPRPTTDGANRWSLHREDVLGTSLDAVVSASSRAVADRAEAAALAEFTRQSRLLSAWDAESEFSRWQRTHGVPVKVSPELLAVLQQFDRWQGETGGVLNASSETAAALWRHGVEPSTAELHAAVVAMGQPHWQLDSIAGTATRLGAAPLVLASFVKSLVTGAAADAALRAGATGVMLNVGGDIVTRGVLAQTVDIADPKADAENDLAIDTVQLQDRAIATSGGYRRGFAVAGEHRSHLIDPRTAMPASGVLSSSVIAADPATAGALATALSILSPRESEALMERHPGTEYLLMIADGERIVSKGWAQYQQARVTPAGYRVPAAGAGVPTSGNWVQGTELVLKVEVPRMDNPRYRRPYVAVWVEDKDKYPVRTIALWFQKPRWLNELKSWYRDDQIRNLSEGTDISANPQVSSATRAPGTYTLRWDGKDNEGKLVKAGKYTVVVEAAREHGGHSLVRQEIDFNGTPAQFSLPANQELGMVQLDYRKH